MEQQSMGKRIMALRKEKGITQEQLADRVGVTAQAVSKWENDLSCPDISILPAVADALGITTDELLGVKPMEPRVVVVEKGSAAEKAADGAHSVKRGFRHSGVWFALLLILLGASLLLTKLGVIDISIWHIVWPAVLIGCGVAWTINDFSPFAVAVALLGLYYLLYNLGATSYKLTWGVIWPVLVIVIGLSILLECLWPHSKRKKHAYSDSYDGHEKVSEYSEEAGFVHYDCTFGEENRRVSGERFVGAKVDLSFGKSVLDLTQIKEVAPGAAISAEVSFGSFELLVPRSIRVDNVSDRAFGSVQTVGMADSTAQMTISVNGSVSFGSIIIRYV